MRINPQSTIHETIHAIQNADLNDDRLDMSTLDLNTIPTHIILELIDAMPPHFRHFNLSQNDFSSKTDTELDTIFNAIREKNLCTLNLNIALLVNNDGRSPTVVENFLAIFPKTLTIFDLDFNPLYFERDLHSGSYYFKSFLVNRSTSWSNTLNLMYLQHAQYQDRPLIPEAFQYIMQQLPAEYDTLNLYLYTLSSFLQEHSIETLSDILSSIPPTIRKFRTDGHFFNPLNKQQLKSLENSLPSTIQTVAIMPHDILFLVQDNKLTELAIMLSNIPEIIGEWPGPESEGYINADTIQMQATHAAYRRAMYEDALTATLSLSSMATKGITEIDSTTQAITHYECPLNAATHIASFFYHSNSITQDVLSHHNNIQNQMSG